MSRSKEQKRKSRKSTVSKQKESGASKSVSTHQLKSADDDTFWRCKCPECKMMESSKRGSRKSSRSSASRHRSSASRSRSSRKPSTRSVEPACCDEEVDTCCLHGRHGCEVAKFTQQKVREPETAPLDYENIGAFPVVRLPNERPSVVPATISKSAMAAASGYDNFFLAEGSGALDTARTQSKSEKRRKLDSELDTHQKALEKETRERKELEKQLKKTQEEYAAKIQDLTTQLEAAKLKDTQPLLEPEQFKLRAKDPSTKATILFGQIKECIVVQQSDGPKIDPSSKIVVIL